MAETKDSELHYFTKFAILPRNSYQSQSDYLKIEVGDKLCGYTEKIQSSDWIFVHCKVPETPLGKKVKITMNGSNAMSICGVKAYGKKSNKDCEQDIPMSQIIDTSASSCTVDEFEVATYEGCFLEQSNHPLKGWTRVRHTAPG